MSNSDVEDYRRSSPWPLFVALGLAVSEVGIVLPAHPVAVGGLLLFVGSVVGIVVEAGYAESPWPLLAGLAVVLVGLGAAVFVLAGGSLGNWFVPEDRIAFRGVAIATAGLIALLVAVVGYGLRGRDVEPV